MTFTCNRCVSTHYSSLKYLGRGLLRVGCCVACCWQINYMSYETMLYVVARGVAYAVN